jgi:capsular exopolysaccharide synthesis family protein
VSANRTGLIRGQDGQRPSVPTSGSGSFQSQYRGADYGDQDVIISPQFILRVLWQWWYLLLPVSLLCSAAAASAVYITFRPVYRASAQIQIASDRPFVAYESRERIEKKYEFVETQVELLKSPLVLNPVSRLDSVRSIPEVRDQADVVSWLAENLRVNQVGKSELYLVAFEALDPKHAALIANEVIDSYFRVQRDDNDFQSRRVTELLDQVKADLLTQEKRLQVQLKELMGSTPFATLPSNRGDAVHPLLELQKQLSAAELNDKLIDVEIKVLEEEIASAAEVPVPRVDVEMTLRQNEEIRRLTAHLAEKRDSLLMMERNSAKGKDTPWYRSLEREVNELQRQLDHMIVENRPQIHKDLGELAILDREDSLQKRRAEKRLTKDRLDLLQQQYEQQYKELAATDATVEIQAINTKLGQLANVQDVIDERLMALYTETRAPQRVILRQRAVPPPQPVERIPIRNIVLSVLASGSLPLALVLAWELSIRRITNVDQLASRSRLSVVGEVAKLPLRVQISRPARRRSLSLFEESIDSLRVCLWLPEEHKHVRVLAVCSAIHGEGKTSIASQLAVSTASSTNEPVLLIDADLRSPDLHHIFEIALEPGLARVLDRGCSIDDAIVTQWSEKVHLLPAGRLTKSPHALLGGDEFPQLLEQLRSRYRTIIIDTPPILSAAEALLLAKLADGAIICTRRNYSRERQVQLAYERLLAAGAKPMGAVFNAVPTRRYAYTYGSYDYTRRISR